MSSWLQRVVVSVDLAEDARETLKYAAFLADTYGASLDVLNVTDCAGRAAESSGTAAPCSQASSPDDADCGRCTSLSVAERRQRIDTMLAALPSEAARTAEVQIGEPSQVEGGLRGKQYDLAILDDRCGRRCSACQGCPVLEALEECPTCGMMRVEGPVQLPPREE